MTHQEKVQLLLADLTQRGVWKSTVAPPVYRALWKCGIHVRPPHFASFGFFALAAGAWFALFWGLFMWLLLWRHQNVSPVAACVTALCAGIFFGLTLSAYYRWQARKLSLPKWEDYPSKTI